MKHSDLDLFQAKDLSRDYRARNLFARVPGGRRLLDIGSGNGGVAEFLKGKFEVIVLSDDSDHLVNLLREKFQGRSDVSVMQFDAEKFHLNECFDVVTICDVLEHLENDAGCLRSAASVLSAGGRIFISVPAFPFLYGVRDRRYGHVRRYTKKGLRELARSVGLRITDLYYWNFVGFFPYLVSEKLFKRALVAPARVEPLNISGLVVNTILNLVLRIESMLPLPLGLTLIAVCEKDEQDVARY